MSLKWAGGQEAKVAMTVYVTPQVKRGMKTAATLAGTTTSKVVEGLCREFLDKHPDIGNLVRKRR